MSGFRRCIAGRLRHPSTCVAPAQSTHCSLTAPHPLGNLVESRNTHNMGLNGRPHVKHAPGARRITSTPHSGMQSHSERQKSKQRRPLQAQELSLRAQAAGRAGVPRHRHAFPTAAAAGRRPGARAPAPTRVGERQLWANSTATPCPSHTALGGGGQPSWGTTRRSHVADLV